ncbi:MAG: glutamate racemase [Cyanobacteria bacterium K_Offshore_surface_m2_239]|nr:glutamate racemase [Cyanobacteria bacterium K_Offshore_surface_m2_239]
MTNQPIGLFDSGVGGLSVWRELVRQLPTESTLYVADSAHVPYGNRSGVEVMAFCEGLCRFLIDQGCKAVVVACNTASAVALEALRGRYPAVPILGLEPAVKPAISLSRNKVVGVMATPATFQGHLFRATVGRCASGVRLVEQVCLGLADCVESGAAEEELERLLRSFLDPMLAADADTIVLGCTHYPFVIETIRRLAGPERRVIDPAPAVAAHLARVLSERDLAASSDARGVHRFFTTGTAARFDAACQRLVGLDPRSEELGWQRDGAGLWVVRAASEPTAQQ